MRYVKGAVPIKIWTNDEVLDSASVDMSRNVASLPFIFKHVALMPDYHLGVGAVVGSVVATKGAICPATVGVDIGCGMMAIKTDLEAIKVLDKLPEIRKLLEEKIPVGHHGNQYIKSSVSNWAGWKTMESVKNYDNDLLSKARSQLGTLGGGNHFIEVCLDTEDKVWLMLHSGSRNVGKVLAERHIETARGLMKKMFVRLPDPDLAYLVEQTREFDEYMHDLMWAQDYAAANRNEMMLRFVEVMRSVVNGGEPFKEEVSINCHHNYASRENHYAESFCSCSHGAGRRMSRSEAKRQFTLEDVLKQTAGVECRKDEGIIDELPGSYKDIDEVMENQKDLVEIVATLKQVLCVKG